jgi:hypothetical protein
MTNDAFKDIEKLETDLWEAADNLHANSKLTSSDYFMPVLGVIFLRHAANRFDAAHRQIEADRASGKMPRRKVLPADYIARRSLYLPKKARYDWIMEKAALSGGELPELVTAASLDAEQRRAAEEGPTDDELALFELLFKDSMSKKDRERLKQASRGLLSSLRDLLAPMPGWMQNATTQAEVKVFILDRLWGSLPRPPFTDADTEDITSRVYDYVMQRSASGQGLTAA